MLSFTGYFVEKSAKDTVQFLPDVQFRGQKTYLQKANFWPKIRELLEIVENCRPNPLCRSALKKRPSQPMPPTAECTIYILSPHVVLFVGECRLFAIE
jgi:hypothetical protein